jgi:hypothetical protein
MRRHPGLTVTAGQPPSCTSTRPRSRRQAGIEGNDPTSF